MPASVPADLDRLDAIGRVQAVGDVQTMQLLAEHIAVSKRVRKTRVRIERTTRTRDAVVEEELNHDQVVVERVAIGRVVDAVPDVREEGDVTILPVVEEEIVVQRRLVLKEQVHIRRVRTVQRHAETVTLREQEAAVTRTDLED